ncbi:FBP domain-containing protein [Virgisporangium ochraceum]|uniref:FBP domain-containing protein n=1 Tax=Virgisporangium ochraceum TaxID=65505 RepID=UPI001941727E|nr:FBP domain-containing protein [Virgisporangium ochraceum]
MRSLDEREIRSSFVNCSKGEVGRIRMPSGLGGIRWADLDYLGWTDPGAPLRSLLVVPRADGVTGLVLRRPEASGAKASAVRSTMCRVCLTEHGASGVALFVAPLAGAAGRRGNTVGEYLCADLACSLYLRGKRQPRMRLVRREETLTMEERIDRAMANLSSFVDRVTAG